MPCFHRNHSKADIYQILLNRKILFLTWNNDSLTYECRYLLTIWFLAITSIIQSFTELRQNIWEHRTTIMSVSFLYGMVNFWLDLCYGIQRRQYDCCYYYFLPHLKINHLIIYDLYKMFEYVINLLPFAIVDNLLLINCTNSCPLIYLENL